ncbi:winged helix-turn-helix transcriptional regulator [Parapusillimonas sp. JC17]|uniref:winged helix-turn-helix transcriptional regulator n=1 Tax=Parapusillimonas sp. JC17 TaxID=3445768 RepID=UPI003F9EBE16
MAIKRSYADGCAAAHALDLVGERWALLIVRELLLGPKRFTDLRAGLTGISPNVLTQRLGELESAFVVRRRRLPPPASAWAYELTDWGRELEPPILELVRWGLRSPAFIRGAPLGIDPLVLSFKALADPQALAGCELRLQMRFDTQVFSVQASGGALNVRRGEDQHAQVSVVSDTQTMLRLAYGKGSLQEAQRAGTISLSGDAAVLQGFFDLFSLPGPGVGPHTGSDPV